MKAYFGSRPLEPELAAQKLLPVRALSSNPPELVLERSAPFSGAELGERADFLLRYEVFPERLLRAWGQWRGENRLMREGDTIVQEAAMPPMRWGVRLLFGARVTEVVRTPTEASFTYATLTSHPETGVNTFALRLVDRKVVAHVSSRAEPGHRSMKLAGPVVMAYADWCKKAAVEAMLTRFLA